MDKFIIKRQRLDSENVTALTSVSTSSGGSAQSMGLENSTNEFDVGRYVGDKSIPDDVKITLLKNPWIPDSKYNFKSDIESGRRCFSASWLDTYRSWLIYSATLKGALCKHCVIFKPKIERGLQGAFITKAFTRYKHFSEQIKIHLKSKWHAEALEKSQNFAKIMENNEKSIIMKLDHAKYLQTEKNRKILRSILSSIKFCGAHDIALRGKNIDQGNFTDLLEFRVNSGDVILKDHMDNCKGNAKYISVQIQNELIQICGEIIRNEIIIAAKNSKYFSVLADETADISGNEQMSIGIRYVDINNQIVVEEFLGFTALKQLDAENIAQSITDFLSQAGLDLNNLVGQGYDGCSAMAGKENGVQAKIRSKYPKALFFHCASHKLNLVVNDLNSVVDVRNAIAIIKSTINFFRESTLRRHLLPNIPMLCETRWTEKYKSIRVFAKNFIRIVDALEDLSVSANSTTSRSKALQICNSLKTTSFIISLVIIEKYSAFVEPVANILQDVQMNIDKVKKHITLITNMCQEHRVNADEKFKSIWEEAVVIASNVGITLCLPRILARQTYRANYQTDTPEKYYCTSIYIPYLDSLISSLLSRFQYSDVDIGYSLLNLHPTKLQNLSCTQLDELANKICSFYELENENLLKSEIHLWSYKWKSSGDLQDLTQITISYLLSESKQLYPAIYEVLQILLTLPCTTCTVERSFSTLRRVKTWIRSTISDERLNGLSMLSIHRKRVKQDANFDDKIISKFAEVPRKLQFLFE